MNLKLIISKRTIIMVCGWMLVFCLTACGMDDDKQQPEEFKVTSEPERTESSGQAAAENSEQTVFDGKMELITKEGNEIIFQLNDSPAANALYQQLPLSIEVDDYAGSEKIFYPPIELDTQDTPMAQGSVGTLAYYAPWGNVAIFYEECSDADGLYELGEIFSGMEFLAGISGEIEIRAVHEPANEINSQENETMKMNVQVKESTFTATLNENAAAAAFVELMEDAPVVIQMSDYSGFEKVGSLGTNLPADNSQTTTQSGDIVLYNGNQIVIFYGSNSWSYTRLGKIDDLTGWEDALGSGDVTVTFSVN